MSDVLKCPTNLGKKCPYMSDVLKCPTLFLKKVSLYVRHHEMSSYFVPNHSYMSACTTYLSHFPYKPSLYVRLHIYLPICPPNQESVRLYMYTLVGGGGVGGVLHALKNEINIKIKSFSILWTILFFKNAWNLNFVQLLSNNQLIHIKTCGFGIIDFSQVLIRVSPIGVNWGSVYIHVRPKVKKNPYMSDILKCLPNLEKVSLYVRHSVLICPTP